MGGQDHQARITLPHGVDHGSGLPQAVPAADPGDVADLQQVSVVGQVADHHQRRPAWPAHQQRHGAGRVPGGGQQDQAAVTEQVVTCLEGSKIRVAGQFRLNPLPAQAGQVNVPAHQPAHLRQRAGQRVPLGLADHDVGVAQLGQAADVVLVEMRKDRDPDIAGGVAEPVQPGAEGLLRADLEPGQAAVQHPGDGAGEIAGIGDRGPVLTGVEQHQAVAVLDDVGVDGQGPGPAPGG
jgi:hypothetical protein